MINAQDREFDKIAEECLGIKALTSRLTQSEHRSIDLAKLAQALHKAYQFGQTVAGNNLTRLMKDKK